MQDLGSVHIHRQILASGVWSLPPTRLKVWLLILLRASEINEDVRVGGRKFSVARGTLVAVEGELADAAGLSVETLRQCLTDLAADPGRLVVRRGGKHPGRGRVMIRVPNYDQYQRPCVAPEEPEPTTPTAKRRERVGALAWADAKRALADERGVVVGRAVRRLRESGRGLKDDQISILAGGEAWAGCHVLDWIGRFDQKWESVFGSRSSEIIAATKRDLTALAPLIGRMMRTLRVWADGLGVAPEGLMFEYLRWRFEGERKKNAFVVANGGAVRNPITLAECFDHKALDKWWTSRRIERIVASDRSDPADTIRA